MVKYGEVSIERGGVEFVWIPESDWKSVCHTDYGCADEDAPFHTLADFPAVPASASDSSVSYSVCRDDNLTKYQSIERDSTFTLTCTFPFKCHIRPKSYAPLKDNANNLLALSWTVHEFFDGVHTVDRSTGATDIPLIAIKPPESQDNFTTSIMGEPTEQRTEVEVSIICFNDIVGGVIAKHLREACLLGRGCPWISPLGHPPEHSPPLGHSLSWYPHTHSLPPGHSFPCHSLRTL